MTIGLPICGQEGPAVEPLRFHHVHLNSTDPVKAAEYYPKAFALSAKRTTFNGYEAVKTGDVYLLFTKVTNTPQNELTAPQTSILAFRLEHAQLAAVQREVPCDGPGNRADVGRRRWQAGRYVE